MVLMLGLLQTKNKKKINIFPKYLVKSESKIGPNKTIINKPIEINPSTFFKTCLLQEIIIKKSIRIVI